MLLLFFNRCYRLFSRCRSDVSLNLSLLQNIDRSSLLIRLHQEIISLLILRWVFHHLSRSWWRKSFLFLRRSFCWLHFRFWFFKSWRFLHNLLWWLFFLKRLLNYHLFYFLHSFRLLSFFFLALCFLRLVNRHLLINLKLVLGLFWLVYCHGLRGLGRGFFDCLFARTCILLDLLRYFSCKRRLRCGRGGGRAGTGRIGGVGAWIWGVLTLTESDYSRIRLDFFFE